MFASICTSIIQLNNPLLPHIAVISLIAQHHKHKSYALTQAMFEGFVMPSLSQVGHEGIIDIQRQH